MSSEIRKDYFTEKLVVVAPGGPGKFEEPKREGAESDPSPCPYCYGNEEMTPPAELVLVQKEGTLMKLSDAEGEIVRNWSVRIFPHSSPAVSVDSPPSYGESPLYSEPAYGYHLIIIASPDHNLSFSELSIDQLVNILASMQDRMRWLYNRKGVSYVAAFMNSGKEAGAQFSHPHLQLMTLPRVPPVVEEEAEALKRSLNETGICPMCQILNVELRGPRQVLATDTYLAFTPWASTHSFEYWVFPRRHQTSFLKTTQKDISDLALILRATLGGLSKALKNPSFNLVFHTSSEKKATKPLHWHIEVYPQFVKSTGLELGSGVYLNRVTPEEAAKTLGAASRKELARLIGIT